MPESHKTKFEGFKYEKFHLSIKAVVALNITLHQLFSVTILSPKAIAWCWPDDNIIHYKPHSWCFKVCCGTSKPSVMMFLIYNLRYCILLQIWNCPALVFVIGFNHDDAHTFALTLEKTRSAAELLNPLPKRWHSLQSLANFAPSSSPDPSVDPRPPKLM